MATKKEADDLDAATCAICKDIYKNPVKISCDHSFCEDCIDKSWTSTRDNPICPICRKSVDGKKKMDIDMMTTMSKTKAPCNICSKAVILTEYRRHQRICKDRGASAAESSRPRRTFVTEEMQPNIYTFECPYCPSKNLGRESLVTHVNTHHKEDQTQVVCPICKAMPWGDANQCSQDFPSHLNIRHKFDYDRFVDLNQDEDAALESAISLSYRHY